MDDTHQSEPRAVVEIIRRCTIVAATDGASGSVRIPKPFLTERSYPWWSTRRQTTTGGGIRYFRPIEPSTNHEFFATL